MGKAAAINSLQNSTQRKYSSGYLIDLHACRAVGLPTCLLAGMGTRNGRLVAPEKTPKLTRKASALSVRFLDVGGSRKKNIILFGQAETGKTCWYKSCKRFLVGDENEFDTTMLYKQVGDSFGEAVVTAAKQLLLLVNQHGVSFTSTSIIDADWSVLEQVSVETEFSPQLATACAALWGDDKVQRVFHSTRRLEAYLPATTEELLDNALVHFGNEYAQAELDSSCIYTPTKSTQDHTLLLPGLDLTIMDSSGHSLQNPNHKWATQCPNQDLIVFFVSLCGYARRTTDGSANQLMQSLESFNQLMLVLNMDPRHLQECPAHQLFEESALGKPSERESVTRVHVVFTMLDLLDSFLADVPLQQVFPEFKEAGTSHAAAAFIQSLFVSIFKFHRGASAHLSSHYVNARSPKDCIGVLEKLCGSNGLVVAEDAPSGCCGT